MKKIKTLKKNLTHAKMRLIDEFSSVDKLEKMLKEIEKFEKNRVNLKTKETLVPMIDDLIKKSIKKFRWVKRPTSRLQKYGKKVEDNLAKIQSLHPPQGMEKEVKELDDALTKRLELLSTLITRFSFGKTGEGKINKDMKTLKDMRKKFKSFKKKPKEFEIFMQKFYQAIDETEKDVKFLITWIRSTAIVIEKIEQLEKKLEEIKI